MSETPWTPDWYVEQVRPYGICVRTRSRKRRRIVAQGEPPREEDAYVATHLASMDEARLIAKAPAMAALLEDLEQWLGPVSPDSSCHVAICTPEECTRCGRILRIRSLLAAIKGETP